MDEGSLAERALHPIFPATAWGVGPWAFDGSVACQLDALEQVPSSCRRAWHQSAPADLSQHPAQSAADSIHFGGMEVIEEARR